jgi:hypothetical protein
MKVWLAIEESRDARVGNQFERFGKNTFDGLNAPVGTIEANAEVLLRMCYGSLCKSLYVLLASVFHGQLAVTEMDISIAGNPVGIGRKVGVYD